LRPRIVGGKAVTKTPRPWIVYVEINAKENKFHCGGSIINKR
jgi:secreted trypsin-like serine protease